MTHAPGCRYTDDETHRCVDDTGQPSEVVCIATWYHDKAVDTVHTIACPKCCRGWNTTRVVEVCERCGHHCPSRGSYITFSLRA